MMDNDEEIVIEEGEIVDDEDVSYCPLKRPENYSAIVGTTRFPNKIEDVESEGELQTTSASDSDDSDVEVYKNKKPKLKIKPLHLPKGKPKKYDIWSNRLQEDVLLETMNSCDVTKKDRSRDVETYDFTLSYSYNESRTNNKRSRNDRKNKNIRPVNKKSEEDKIRSKPRNILDLTVTLDNTIDEVAEQISATLCEEKVDLIKIIVTVLGKEKAMALFQKVRKIELEGGMLIMNQTRRRTPGGVYLFLVKHDNDLTSEQKTEIFGDEKEKGRLDQKLKRQLKREKMKMKIAMEKKKTHLPELLTRAEKCMRELGSNNDRNCNDSDVDDVTNPPPTPETDGQENSGDSADNSNENQIRKIQNYEEDYLDINVANDMDLF